MLGAFFISGTRIPAIERAVTSLLILKWRLFLFPEATVIVAEHGKFTTGIFITGIRKPENARIAPKKLTSRHGTIRFSRHTTHWMMRIESYSKTISATMCRSLKSAMNLIRFSKMPRTGPATRTMMIHRILSKVVEIDHFKALHPAAIRRKSCMIGANRNVKSTVLVVRLREEIGHTQPGPTPKPRTPPRPPPRSPRRPTPGQAGRLWVMKSSMRARPCIRLP